MFLCNAESKTIYPDLIRNAAEGDITSCFKLCSISFQSNMDIKKLIFAKLGQANVVFVCHKYFAHHVSFLKEDIIKTLRVCC